MGDPSRSGSPPTPNPGAAMACPARKSLTSSLPLTVALLAALLALGPPTALLAQAADTTADTTAAAPPFTRATADSVRAALGPTYAADLSLRTNGDLNGDRRFDLFDIIDLEKAVSLGTGVTPEQVQSCDVDGDGQLTGFDLLAMNRALSRIDEGVEMFDAVKGAIEEDLAKSGDNVEIYLDLARFYRKERLYSRSTSVLESILEAMDTRHPLFETVTRTLNHVRGEEAEQQAEASMDILSGDLFLTSGDPTGKQGLRSKVVQLQSRLSNLLKDRNFSANYNSKRVRSRLNELMEGMMRKIDSDQLVDPGQMEDYGKSVRGVLEDRENLVRNLDDEQRGRLNQILDQSFQGLRDEAVRLNQEFDPGVAAAGETGGRDGLSRGMILDRREWENRGRQDDQPLDRLVVANPPRLEPDTISIVAPLYALHWDVSNVLGASDAALELSKVNQKFSNPNGIAQDATNTLYYTPSLGAISGQRKGSALELEGVGIYCYRVAALNNRGELISRFSEARELVVVYNNVNTLAHKPEITPAKVSLENPEYTFRWDASNVEGAKDVAVEISRPETAFDNPNGAERDRTNTYFYNPSLGRLSGTFSSSVQGLAGPGSYLFRVIAVSPYGRFHRPLVRPRHPAGRGRSRERALRRADGSCRHCPAADRHQRRSAAGKLGCERGRWRRRGAAGALGRGRGLAGLAARCGWLLARGPADRGGGRGQRLLEHRSGPAVRRRALFHPGEAHRAGRRAARALEHPGAALGPVRATFRPPGRRTGHRRPRPADALPGRTPTGRRQAGSGEQQCPALRARRSFQPRAGPAPQGRVADPHQHQRHLAQGLLPPGRDRRLGADFQRAQCRVAATGPGAF